jgi:hypothetical protein
MSGVEAATLSPSPRTKAWPSKQARLDEGLLPGAKYLEFFGVDAVRRHQGANNGVGEHVLEQ